MEVHLLKLFQAELGCGRGCGEQYFDDETAENIEKIVNQLKSVVKEGRFKNESLYTSRSK